MTLSVNGREVGRATGCDARAGKIRLTSEGDEVHFRNVRLVVEESGAAPPEDGPHGAGRRDPTRRDRGTRAAPPSP